MGGQPHPLSPPRLAPAPPGRRALRLLGAGAGAGGALLVALALWFAVAQPLQVLPRMRPAPDFSLLADGGRPLRASDLRGRPALISFGAGGCGSECAASEALMSGLLARLAVRGQAQRVALLTISLDPAEAEPAALRGLAAATPGRRWLGGPPETLKALVGGELGVYYRWGPGGLRLDERAVLIDAAGLVRAEYEGARLDPERVLRDLALLEEEAAATGARRGAYEAAHLFLCYVD